MPKIKNLKSKQIEYDGYKFTRDKKTGYYLSARPIYNGKRIMLHRYVWIKHNGDIPEGYSVHHIDENKENNNISNLRLMTNGSHTTLHTLERLENNYEEIRERFIILTQEKAKEWHKSEEGLEWHRQHVKNSLAKTFVKNDTAICIECGKEYKISSSLLYKAKFCSGKCAAKARRHSHLDDIEKECIICGKKFISHKYNYVKTCCKECKVILFKKTLEDKKQSAL